MLPGGGAAARRERDLAEARARALAAANGPVNPVPTGAAGPPQHRPGYKVCPAVNVTTSRPVFYPSPSGRYCAVHWPEASAYVVLDVQLHADATENAMAGNTPSRRDRAAVRPAGAAVSSPRRTPQRLFGTPVRAAADPPRDDTNGHPGILNGIGVGGGNGGGGFFSAGRASLRAVGKAALRDGLRALQVPIRHHHMGMSPLRP
jgi:hypothetical protein